MHHRRILQADQAGVGENMTRGGDSTTTTTSGSRYMSEGNLDTNMVIILAALLCALIFALGLNSIVRCALRCSRRVALETPQRGLGASTAGLKKRELRQIPVTIYGTTTSNSISCGISSRLEECAICLGEFVDGERVRVLPICNHAFHVTCIDTWLLSHSSCPNCRHSLLLDGDKERVSA